METVYQCYVRLNKEILIKFLTRRGCISLSLYRANFMQMEYPENKGTEFLITSVGIQFLLALLAF
jgi:hypothetical protein